MSTQHTPGPWQVGSAFDNYGETEIAIERMTPSGNLVVAVALGGLVGQDANARLIAAAPELLRELVNARREISALHQAYIATVTNQSTCQIDDPDDVLTVEADQDLLNGIDAAIAKATVPTVQRLATDDTEGGAA